MGGGSTNQSDLVPPMDLEVLPLLIEGLVTVINRR